MRGLTRKPVGAADDRVATGEFVLGHQNEYGVATRLPSIGEQDDPEGILRQHPGARQRLRAFAMNGTSLVFRKLPQDPDDFWAFVKGHSAKARGESASDRMASGLTIQAQPAPRRLSRFPRFVTVKGGGCFFMPGLKTLKFLAAEPSKPSAVKSEK
ncbi:MAG: hypothetical protein ACREQT_05995 [Candidatus Binataceae bacterium]